MIPFSIASYRRRYVLSCLSGGNRNDLTPNVMTDSATKLDCLFCASHIMSPRANTEREISSVDVVPEARVVFPVLKKPGWLVYVAGNTAGCTGESEQVIFPIDVA